MIGLPHACVVLAIDPGETSGWSVWSGGTYLDSGIARVPVERAVAVRRALREAAESGHPLIVAAERWMPVSKGKWTPSTIAGTGAQWGRWAEQIEMAGIRPSRIVRVEPTAWRHATLGRRNLDRAGWKTWAMTVASGITKRRVGSDEAEAVLIGCWATRAEVVGEAMPKRRKARA